MAVSARDVAAALRERLPGLGKVKLHKLLYYCQGHHLATYGVPLFSEEISAFDMGPVVTSLWADEKYNPPDDSQPAVPLGEAELNTIGYVVSRYGRWTGRELEIQTHGEAPWQRANEGRLPGTRKPIQLPWIAEYFREAQAADREDDVPLDSGAVSDWLAGAERRRQEPVTADSVEEILARLSRA